MKRTINFNNHLTICLNTYGTMASMKSKEFQISFTHYVLYCVGCIEMKFDFFNIFNESFIHSFIPSLTTFITNS